MNDLKSAAGFDRAHATTPVAVAGAGIAAAFFLGFGGWAALAPLQGATVAPAIVAPESHRKTIQHLEGGIISEVSVKDGSTVAAGDVLVRLDDTQVRAEVAELQARMVARRAQLGRLRAEQTGGTEPEFDSDLRKAARSRPEVAVALALEQSQMRERGQALDSQIGVFMRRAAAERQTIVGLEASIASYHEQIKLIGEEIETVEALLRKGLERKPRLLTLLRTRSELGRSAAASLSDKARANEAIAEAEQESRALIETRGAEIAASIVEAQSEAAELKEKITAGFDRLARTRIRAPAAGTVVNLRFKTLRGVVAPGGELMDLVPADDQLVLEARVAPNDIDDVVAGLTAQVHLTAYRQRTLPRVEGLVDNVSADVLIDEDTGAAYYAARITISHEQLAALGPGISLTPGMQADALIVTRERTLLDYLLAPVADAMRRGMRET